MADDDKKVEIEDLPESEEEETKEAEKKEATSDEIDIEEAVIEDVDELEEGEEEKATEETNNEEVSEETEEKEEKETETDETEEETEETEEEVTEEAEKKDQDVLERVVEEEKADKELEEVVKKDKKVKKPKKSKIKLKDKQVKRTRSGSKDWKKIAAFIVVALLVVAASVLGVMYYLNQRNNEPVEVVQEETQQEEVVEEETVTEEDESVVYINSAVGLNLREEPNTSSKVLIIIPFGIEIPVLAEESGWIQTEYDGKKGWCSADYTQKTNPWEYENKKYGFSMTFDGGWEGYKFFEESVGGVPVLYLGLPTTESSYLDNSVDSGYASLFAISVYTPEKWNEVKNSEGPKPALLKETSEYVFAWSSAQARPDDLKVQFDEIKTIIDTFKIN